MPRIKERIVCKVMDKNGKEFEIVEAEFRKGELLFLKIIDEKGELISVDNPSFYRIFYKKEPYFD